MFPAQSDYARPNTTLRRGVFLTSLTFIIVILLYAFAESIPVALSWENGVFENLQVLLLSIGALWALGRWVSSSSPHSRGLWLIVMLLWIVLVMRELSWGAVFYTPLAHSDLSGPTFSSTAQLWYKPLVTPILVLIMVFCTWLFIRTRQYETLVELWRRGDFPLIESVLIIITMTLSAAAEGHLGLSLDLSKGAYQVFEEGLEVWSYSLLLVMQRRVIRGTTDVVSANMH